MKLTANMQETLIQIGYGVSGTDSGFRDENNNRVDMRSVKALYARGLVDYHTTGGAPARGCLSLTSDGWEIFREITNND